MLDHFTHEAPHDVVFVHGAGGNNLLWNRTLQYLTGDARAVAVNLPGHPSGAITCTSISDYAQALHLFLQESGLRSPAVCGHSMGGAVALTLAIRHPESIGGLVLVSTGARLGVDQRLIQELRAAPMKAIESVITPWSFSSIDLGLGREARTALSVSNLPVFLNDYLACQGFDVRSDLSKITAKTLVVCGDKDRMTPPKWSHYLGAHISGAELRFVKDSGHMLPLEKPEPLARLLHDFLVRLSP
jgi:pimeloyl-ACP methyl ester carboxylesterase